MERKLKVGVIFGGKSGEHEVSLLSAQSIMKAIDRSRYDIIPIGITKAGEWLTGRGAMQYLADGKENDVVTGVTALDIIGNKDLTDAQDDDKKLDIVFPVLHGPFGEDGTVQGLLELADVPYVGAGVLGSAAGMDKLVMKAIFAQEGIPGVPYIGVLRHELANKLDEIIAKIEGKIGYPCFVKPANLGSSVGISKAHDRAELEKALELAAEFDRRIIVEKGVNAREIECAILGNDEPMASLPGEIVSSNEFYDYKAKYIDGSSGMSIPARLSEEKIKEVREYAVRAFKAIDCAGLARVDFFVSKDDDSIYINEINTLPGFTNFSMYPKMWEATGIPYSELVNKLIELAIERYNDRKKNKVSAD